MPMRDAMERASLGRQACERAAGVAASNPSAQRTGQAPRPAAIEHEHDRGSSARGPNSSAPRTSGTVGAERAVHDDTGVPWRDGARWRSRRFDTPSSASHRRPCALHGGLRILGARGARHRSDEDQAADCEPLAAPPRRDLSVAVLPRSRAVRAAAALDSGCVAVLRCADGLSASV